MKLLQPWTLRDLKLKNRIALAPLTRSRAGQERLANQLMAEYYVQRSSAGLLISEATSISKDGIGWQNNPGIWSSEQAQAWRVVTDAVHQQDTPIFLQLWHCGRASHSTFPEREGKLPAAPSAVRLNGDYARTPVGKMEYEVPRSLSLEEIDQTIEDYRNAARLAKEAGFDGIEIHAANGYLLDQFLQSKTNKREDQFGGSVENRYRLLDRVVGVCLDTWSPDRIGVRLAPNGVFNDMGSPDFRETFLYAAKCLNHHNLAYLHIMDGLAFGFHKLGEPMQLAEFREVFDGALIGNCGYTKESAETAIDSGSADMIAFGRPYISNPDLVERFENNWPLEDVPDMSVWYSFGAEGYTDFRKYAN